MHSSDASERRRAQAQRRRQLRRRRVVALVVLVTLIVIAVWAAYAVPSATPARVPETAGLPSFADRPTADGTVVVARLEGLEVVLPIARQATTAVAYHPVDNRNTVSFSPAGTRLNGGVGQKLADIFTS